MIISKVSRKVHDIIKENCDLRKDTHIKSDLKICNSFIDVKLLDISKISLNKASYLLDMYLNHYFDLLGSGFVKVDYNINPIGIEGIKYNMSPKITDFDYKGDWLYNILLLPHINYSKNIWKSISKGYTPIDWNMDFKSGFRYSQKTW